QTSKSQWVTAEMEAKKLGVIVPVSREFLQYSVSDFFTQVRPLIAEAFYKKFDEATILNVDNAFSQSLQQSVVDEDGHVIEGNLNYDTLMDLYGVLKDADHDPNVFVTKRTNNSAFRGIVETVGPTVSTIPRNALLFVRLDTNAFGSW